MTQQEIDIQIQARKEVIQNCESQLKASDYKIIKCAEDKARGVAKANLPYNIDTLHEERQALREQINAAQGEIDVLTAEVAEDVRENTDN